MTVQENLLVRRAEKKKNKHDKPFYDLTLVYPGGRTIEGKVWAEAIKEDIIKDTVIGVYAKEGEFNGQPQLTVESYKIHHGVDIEIYKQPPAVPQKEPYLDLFSLERFQLPEIKTMLFHIRLWMEKTEPDLLNRLWEAPAAKRNHHARRTGLLQHLKEMTALAGALMTPVESSDRQYNAHPITHPGVRIHTDIVYAGILLHDLGKIFEYQDGSFDANRELSYAPHVAWAALVVERNWGVVHQNPDELENKMRLIHCLLSHHRYLEWGSPVTVRTPEASILHYVDMLSAHFDVHTTAQSVEKPEMTKTLEDLPITPRWPPREHQQVIASISNPAN